MTERRSVLAAFGCLLTIAPLIGAPPPEPAAQILGPHTMNVGEPLRVIFRMRNATAEPRTLSAPASTSRGDVETFLEKFATVEMRLNGQILSLALPEKESLDTTREIVLAPGEKTDFPIDLRGVFKLPLDEKGVARLEVRSQGFFATTQFTIVANPRVLLRQTLEWQGKGGAPFSREYVVLRGQGADGGRFTLAQRAPGEEFKRLLNLDAGPVALRAVKLNEDAASTEGVLVFWLDAKNTLHAVPPYLLWRTPISLKDCGAWPATKAASVDDVEAIKSQARDRLDLRIVLSGADKASSSEICLRYESYAFQEISHEEFLKSKQAAAPAKDRR